MSKTRQRGRGPFEAPPGRVVVLAYEYAHGHHIPRHSHVSHQLVYASAGAMTVHTEAGTFVVPPSRAVWVPGSTAHAIDMSGAVSMRTLYLAPTLWPRAPRACRVISVGPLLRALILTAIEQRGLDRRRARDARLIGVLIDQLASGSPLALHVPALRDPRAARVAARAHAKVTERLPLAALAVGTGASARTLERLFRSETGMSFGQWRRHVSQLHALQRLAAGEQVTSAALEAGYTSVSAFIAAFRKTFGFTPGSYLRGRDPV